MMGHKVTIKIGNRQITIRSATLMDGISRLRLRDQLLANEQDPDRRVLAAIYADLVSVSELDAPMTMEELAAMEEKEVDRWNAEVQKLNPHWYATAQGETQAADG